MQVAPIHTSDCCGFTAASRVIVQSTADVAEFEKSRISERTKEALAELSARGKQLGMPANLADTDICVADISLAKPNVWFEVGFALASAKDVVLVCKRGSKFPFDVQHRTIIEYGREPVTDECLADGKARAHYRMAGRTCRNESDSPRVYRGHQGC
jgi:hypothetical protein